MRLAKVTNSLCDLDVKIQEEMVAAAIVFVLERKRRPTGEVSQLQNQSRKLTGKSQ